MDLYQIRYFLAVCDTHNFTRAAERCHVTQPSLTRAIQNLELELRGQLFIRSCTGTVLTPLGDAIRQELTQAQKYVHAARVTAEGWTKGTKAVLRVGVSNATNPTGVAQFLGTFQQRHEGIALTVCGATADDLRSRLRRSDIDAALIANPTGFSPGPRSRFLYEEPLVVMVPISHRLSAFDEVPIGELAGERILINVESDLQDAIHSALRSAEVCVRIACQTSCDTWLAGMVSEGAGIAIVPSGSPMPPSIVARPLASPFQSQSVHLALPDNADENPTAQIISRFADQFVYHDPNQHVVPIQENSMNRAVLAADFR